MRATPTSLPGVVVLELEARRDQRGILVETYRRERYFHAGIGCEFVQDIHSRSVKGVIRGLHFQVRHPQAKLVRVTRGQVFDVAVDVRLGSPTFGQWFGVELSDENLFQLYIPEGFAHGYAVLSDVADFEYKTTDYYIADDQAGVLWEDPELGINWPVRVPILSEKDRRLPRLSQATLPLYGECR